MQKKEKKKNIKIYEIALVIIVLLILVIILVTNKDNNLKRHCINAVCNEDSTICYNYTVNSNNQTVKTWEGNCSKVK